MESPKLHLINLILKSRKRNFESFRNIPGFSRSNQPGSAISLSNLDKGTAFEKFVVCRFDDNYFNLIEWRSDKSINGISAIMNKLPDLEFYFESNNEILQFAVECKWREYMLDDCIEFKNQQLEVYRRYQDLTGSPVFVIIGIGNTPSSPNAVYIIPLSEIKENRLHEFQIQIYKRKDAHHNFFIDCKNQRLK